VVANGSLGGSEEDSNSLGSSELEELDSLLNRQSNGEDVGEVSIQRLYDLDLYDR
jgi:hypothetical protein